MPDTKVSDVNLIYPRISMIVHNLYRIGLLNIDDIEYDDDGIVLRKENKSIFISREELVNKSINEIDDIFMNAHNRIAA